MEVPEAESRVWFAVASTRSSHLPNFLPLLHIPQRLGFLMVDVAVVWFSKEILG